MKKQNEVLEYMLPQNDYIFKRLFGYEGNEHITKNLVSNIIGEEIKKLEFKNTHLLRNSKDDKEETLDIKAMLNNNIQCDIEIQVGNYHDLEKRMLDYWAKMYRESIGKKKKYVDMKRTIVIFITTFNIDKLKGIEQYKTKWKILEEKLKIELTDVFELDIIELSKAKRQLKKGTFDENQHLKDWVKFLINPKELEETKMENLDKEIKEAYDLWQSLNQNAEERDEAERRFLNLNSRKYAQEIERKLGREEGREEGKKIKQKEIAKEMLKEKMDISLIVKITKLTEEEIEKLK